MLSKSDIRPEQSLAVSSIGDMLLAMGGLDSSLQYHVETTLRNEVIARDLRGAGLRFEFSEADRDIPVPMKRKLKHLVKLIRKLDHKKRYISLIEIVQADINQAIIIRNCLVHAQASFYPVVGEARKVVLTRTITKEFIQGYPMINCPIRFGVSVPEMFAIAEMIRRAQMWMHHCVAEVMYDYGFDERDGGQQFEPFPKSLWPHQFHDPPYPWDQVQTMREIAG